MKYKEKNRMERTKPVVCVDWDQAKAYCESLGQRLPTEAEWEKAAAGPEGYIWSFGNRFDGEKVNFCDKNCSYGWGDRRSDDGYATTAPVGNYPANTYGLHDMSGNVYEWVVDWYDEKFYDTSEARQKNPENGAQSSGRRVGRGGAWGDFASYLRVAARGRYGPATRFVVVGFRCVAPLPP